MTLCDFFDCDLVWDGHAEFLLRSAIESPTIQPMTICVGALCMNGRAVVLAADRLVVHPGQDLCAEGPDPKIAQLSPRRLLASAGEPPNSFLSRIQSGLSSACSATEVAKKVFAACSELRMERISETITQRQLGMSFEDFLAASGDGKIAEHIVRDIWKAANDYPSTTSFLLGSSDNDGAHLHAIVGMNGHRPIDSPGFGAIGIGANLAMPILYRKPRIKLMDIADAIYLVYEAKRMAENHHHVGRETDLAVILPGQDAHFLNQAALTRLEEIYQKREPSDLTSDESTAIQSFLPHPENG